MNGKAHLLGGLLSIIPAVSLNEPGLLLIPGCILGSVLPDLDADYSTFNKWFPYIAKLYKALPVNRWTIHRGILLHSIFTPSVIFVTMLIFNPGSFLSGLLWGVLSHHALDLLTPKGLNYLCIRRNKK